MNSPIAIVGLGQLGSTLAQGFLLTGRPVVPVLRMQRIEDCLGDVEPTCVILATGEDDLQEALTTMPHRYRDRLVLLQNELRPDQWQSELKSDPTVAIIWFEKRAGRPPQTVLPSVLVGPHAPLIREALIKLELPAKQMEGRAELAHQLVLKNLYILGLNLGGLRFGGTAGGLLADHKESFLSLADEILTLEQALLADVPSFAELRLDEARLLSDLKTAIEADPAHGCAGRSAPRRLERTLGHGRRLGVSTPLLEALKGASS